MHCLAARRELGIGIVPWGLMGSGMLTAAWKSRDDIPEAGILTMASKCSEANFDKVQRRVGGTWGLGKPTLKKCGVWSELNFKYSSSQY